VTAACIASIMAIAGMLASPAVAQLQGGPVRSDSGPLRELSTNVRDGSRPMKEAGRSVREGSGGRFGGKPVREAGTGGLTSGPFSDVSAGPVAAHLVARRAQRMSNVKAVSVTGYLDSPVRPVPQALPVVAQPVHDLGSLRRQLRSIEPVPQEAATGRIEGAFDTLRDTRLAQGDVPEVPVVEPPDAHDPTKVYAPEAQEPVGAPEVEQPEPPHVGAPRESVPIEVEGRDLPQDD
jgi:hypothetical protein